MRYYIIAFTLFAISLFSPEEAKAQADTIFTQSKLCDKVTGAFNREAFISLAVLSLKPEDVIKTLGPNQQIDHAKLTTVVAMMPDVLQFGSRYGRKSSQSYFRIYKATDEMASVEMREVLRRPEEYVIECIDYPPKDTTATALRKSIDTITKAVSKHFVVGKDLDEIRKSLASRNPARVSVTKDGTTDNTLTQTEFAVAGLFTQQVKLADDNVTIAFQPFVTSATTYNSNSKLNDIDKTSAGLMLDFWSVPVLGGRHHFSNRVGYQVDSSRSYEALNGEFVWYPRFTALDTLNLQLGTKYDPPGASMWFLYDVNARYRHGRIMENLTVPTLPADGSYDRVGWKAEAALGFTGDDFLGNLSASASYLYLETLRSSGIGSANVERFDASLNYKLSEFYGFSLSYKKGRDEDLLKKFDQITFALTFKFGEHELGGK